MSIFDNPNLSDAEREELVALRIKAEGANTLSEQDSNNGSNQNSNDGPVFLTGDEILPEQNIVNPELSGDELLMAQAEEYRKNYTPEQLGQIRVSDSVSGSDE